MKYQGKRPKGPGTAEVTINGEPLNTRTGLVNHSPDGFEWGYYGSGPSQLALAILCDYFRRDGQRAEIFAERAPHRFTTEDMPAADRAALCLYQRFKEQKISMIGTDYWTMEQSEIASWLDGLDGVEG